MKRILLNLLAVTSTGLAQVYQESGGLVVMEVENTSSPLGLWQEESSLNTFSGSGYLRFLGNTFETGPPASPLEYHFKINQAGLYYLHLHCAKEIHEGRNDVANDVYVRVEGDYTAGAGPHDGHGDNASLTLLQNDTKYFGGAVDSWKWENGQNSSGGNGNLDPGGHENKRVAVYNFKAGETYKLVMSGRSKFFRANRLVFRHVNTAQSLAQNLNTPESETNGGGGGGLTLVYDAIDDFANITGGDVPYYTDNGNDVLGIAANIVANRTGFARATRAFGGPAGTYDVTITTMTEEDGESEYHLLVNGVRVRSYTNPFVFDPPESPLDLQPHTHTWSGVSIPAGATIGIESNADTNGEIPEAGGTAWARGRWRQLEFTTGTGSLIQPPPGRVAIVSDGNSPDPDDIGAKAVMLGIFKGADLRERLVHLSHSCDLDPFTNPGSQVIDATNELRRQNKLHALSGEGIGFFGPFENLTDYYNCRTSVVGAYNVQAVNDLRDAINASTAQDPLWIIEAGEPDVIGYALQAATPSKRQHVHVISHHPANDNSGDFFTWQQILDFGVTEHQIGDQNVGLQVLISTGLWDWAENHPNPGIAWIWDQLDYAEKDGVVGFQNNKFDCSDAGMLYWWMTGGPNGGDKNSTPVEIRNLLLAEPVNTDAPVAHWPLDEGSGTTAADASGRGNTGTLQNGASWGSDATRSSYVSFDGSDDRISTFFTYALSSGDDFTWAWWANQQSTGTVDEGAIMLGNRYPQPGGGGDSYEFIKLTPTHGQFSTTSDVSQIEKYEYGAIEQGAWHHYAMVKSGTSYQWYVDGVAQGAPVIINYNESAPLPFFIGGDDDGTGRAGEHFEGFIDDVVLYRRALDQSEVVDVSNGIYAPAEPVIQLLAGWDTWDSATAPSPTFLAENVTGSAATTTEDLPWGINDDRGASNDGTWGSFASEPTASTAVATQGNLLLPNATTGGTLSFTLTNNGSVDLVLDGFHFDAYAFRPKAARTYSLEVLAGGGLTAGTVFTSANEAITSVAGANSNDAHDDIDIMLTGLADHTLAVGESVVFRLNFSGGEGDGSGGHHLFVDNVAVTHAAIVAPSAAPEVEAGEGASLTLPADEVILTGTATDDGSIVSTVWTQVSGPNSATLAGEDSLTLTASGLVEGAYLFRLTATDDESNSSFDEVLVTVIPEDGLIVSGELRKWHKVTFSCYGPASSETATTNPFSDYRLNVTFSHAASGKSYTVPGYFAADGDAAETSADAGNIWRVHFAPDEVGEWGYAISFRSGNDVAIDSSPAAGVSGGFFDGVNGTLMVAESDKAGLDLRGKGRLQYVGKHHLQFAETGEYFMKVGPDAPENFLAYDDFDDTPNDPNAQPNLRKSWSPHAGDYDAASAAGFTWQGGKGSEILGAVRYLSQKGLNAFSFLTFSLDGDDDNVFPHRLKSSVAAYQAVADDARWNHANGVYGDRFDVSKMDQWERVFEYAGQLGMYLHFKTQETENDQKMDGGALGRERQLYYRELVARYGHHLALNWNLGEENTNTTAQQQSFAQWFADHDPYGHHVVLHTYPWQKDLIYTPLLGSGSELTGLSLQTNQNDFSLVFADTLNWVSQSAAAGRPWVVAIDEPGDAQFALRPASSPGNSWVDGRKNALWGNVMAGGAGAEFYFGYQLEESDLTLQDYRSRDGFWDYCRYLVQFFEVNNIPFEEMSNANSLVSGAGDNANRCLAKAGEHYVVQLYDGGSHTLDLTGVTGDFDIWWFDPRNGGALQQGVVTSASGGSVVPLGSPPSALNSDWIVYVTLGQGGGEQVNGVMPGLLADADVRDDGVAINVGADTLVPGKSGASGGLDRSTVFVFQLPDLGAMANPFVAATLGFNVEEVSAAPPTVALYGLGARALPTVSGGDYHGDTTALDSTDATLIESDILTGGTGTGFRSSSASANLAGYLNAQYRGGAGIGRYVFLRLSTSEAITGLQRYFVTSADAAGSNGPRISYAAVLPSDFQVWQRLHPFGSGVDSSEEGDPDGDGLSNWSEYLFGLDPMDSSSASPFTVGLEKAAGTFSYTRRNPALTGVTDYQIWTSTNLSDWSEDLTAIHHSEGEEEIQEVMVTLTGGARSESALFVRIVAE